MFKLKRQNYDVRDNKFNIKYKQIISANLPDKINLYNLIELPIFDQGDLGSCTANVISNVILFYLKNNKMKTYQPSRLYIYYFSRLLEGSTNIDSGCNIRNALKSICKYGACDESTYPYKIRKFKKKPPDYCIIEARQHIKQIKYLSISQNLRIIKNCLYRGSPIILGVEIYESFKNKNTLLSGNVSIPDTEQEESLGLHCILLLGYNENTRQFIIQNSWGNNVGINGLFNIPYEYILDDKLATDFWIVDKIL